MKQPVKHFKPEQFEAGRFASRAAKAAYANQFIRFCESGYNPHFFTKAFYNQTHQMWSHIAHYNRHGFYREWFCDADGQKFLDHTLDAPIYRVAEWSDVERALVDWLREPDVAVRIIEHVSMTYEARQAFADSHE